MTYARGLLEESDVPTVFDLLSIDVDCGTSRVWAALTKYKPRVAIIEYNALIPPSIDWETKRPETESWGGRVDWGASLATIERIGRDLGYSLVGCDLTGTNAYFVREDLVGELFHAPFTALEHYEPQRLHLQSKASWPLLTL